MKFNEFLQENKEKHAVLAFGRMNPPTVGHEALVNKVKDVAKHFGGSHHVVLSHTQDSKKNPLTSQQKLKHAKRYFPGTNLSLSDEKAPNFLTQAEKLHKQGVTHLHMVAGSDRTDEYYKLLHKYNGTHKGALFNFKNIKVHSAGERDPDAEGVSGMSASKMREHAKSGNIKEFRKGIPGHVKDEHVKELFKHVRQGMGIKEDVNAEFEDLLQEGVHDKSIFKAVFLGGGPGSGKDYVLDRTLTGHGLTEINSDKALEFLMDKNNLDMRMPENEAEQRNVVRSKAKNMTELKQKLALLGRNGLIINGTGDDVEKIAKIKERLEDLGYDTHMIMVNTADEVSKQRNIERGQRGGRTVPEEIRKQKWDSVQKARPEHAKMFGDNYMEFDNSEDLRSAPPDVIQAKEKELMQLYKGVQKFVNKPPKHPSATHWVASELEKKDTLKINPKREVVPHEGSNAAEEARRMGLQYFGFGRYGQNGKVTHRSVHDKLVEVQPQQERNLKMPVPGTSMKKVNEEFESLLKEDFSFSDSGALNLLLLGNNVDEHDFDEWIHEKKEPKYLTDRNGQIRLFTLRRAAAREAHQKNGTVYPYKNGYVVKLNETKEKDNVQIFEGLICEESSQGRIGTKTTSNGSSYKESSSKTSGLIREETNQIQTCETKKYKISLEEIRRRQKEKIIESIDKGIEPGISMAAAGESPARDMGEKWKKKTGKASQVAETIGDGGEMATSMSDFNDNVLKQKGINLKTFKSRKPIG
jgi:hypothetical protein